MDKKIATSGTLIVAILAGLLSQVVYSADLPSGTWWTKGEIWFTDDMEGLNPDATIRYVNDFPTIARGEDKAFSGKYSLKLTTPNVAGRSADASLYLCLPKYLTRIRLEIKWLSNADTSNLRRLKISMAYYDGTQAHHATIVYWATWGTLRQRWQYINNSSKYVDLFTQKIRMSSTEASWNGAKLIVDFGKDTFDTFISNEKSVNLQGIPLWRTSATGIEPMLGIYFDLITERNIAISAWFDNLVLTFEGES